MTSRNLCVSCAPRSAAVPVIERFGNRIGWRWCTPLLLSSPFQPPPIPESLHLRLEIQSRRVQLVADASPRFDPQTSGRHPSGFLRRRATRRSNVLVSNASMDRGFLTDRSSRPPARRTARCPPDSALPLSLLTSSLLMSGSGSSPHTCPVSLSLSRRSSRCRPCSRLHRRP